MAVRMGRWNCASCSTVNLGTAKFCKNCGDGTTGKWYLLEGEPEITDPELLKKVGKGPNWVCRFCESDNAGSNAFCTQCGASSDGSPRRKVIDYGVGEAPSTAEEVSHDAATVHPTSSPASSFASPLASLNYSTEPSVSYAGPQPSATYTASRPSATVFRKSANSLREPIDLGKFISPAILLMVLGAIAFLGYLALRRYEVTASIAGFDWQRVIHVQEYRTVREGAWSAPAGARNITTEQKVHHYREVFDHYEERTRQVAAGSESYSCGTRDNGDGTFSDRTCSRTIYETERYQVEVTRSEPVYQTWYNYDIDKWLPSRHVPSSSDRRSDPVPYWGQITLKCAGLQQVGCERESGREEHYYVNYSWREGDEIRTFKQEVNRQDWDAFDQLAEYQLIFNGFNTLMNDPLRPEK